MFLPTSLSFKKSFSLCGELLAKGKFDMAIWQVVNEKNPSIRKCAFCKHWYDITNTAIRPRAAHAGFWEFDPVAKKKCLLRPGEKLSAYSCPKFECKL